MSDNSNTSSRRKFLKNSAGVGAGLGAAMVSGATLAQSSASEFLEVDPWTKVQGSTFVNPPYGLPSK